MGDFLDDVEPGQVCVLDNGGRDYCTVWGDIMAMAASMKEIAGTLIYGVCRDVKDVRAIRYPFFTMGYYMVTGKDRVEVAAVNEPVTVAGIKVCPGGSDLRGRDGCPRRPLRPRGARCSPSRGRSRRRRSASARR